MPEQSMTGAYGSWAATLADDPGSRSLLGSDRDLDEWRTRGRDRIDDLLARPELGSPPEATVEAAYDDGLHVEELCWSQPHGPPTKAVLLKPSDATGGSPACSGCTTTAG